MSEFRTIYLGNGMPALVDESDYEELSKFSWNYTRGAASRRTSRKSEKLTTIYMHRQIVKPPSRMEVDHVNRNPLDNRRANLRIATRAENQRNIPVTSRNKLGVKGVYLHCPGWYRSYIGHHGKSHDLGTFRTIEEAAKAYREASLRLHGEFSIFAEVAS